MQINVCGIMDILKVKKINHAFVEIETTPSIRYELSEYYSHYADGYKFSPAYKNKMWDGLIRHFDTRTNRLPLGLVPYLAEFVKSRGYKLELIHNTYYGYPIENSTDDSSFISKYNLTSNGNPIQLKEHQINALERFIKKKNVLIESPTASGKSAIIYSSILYYLEKHEGNILLIVPSISLVNQMYSDFADYSEYDELFNVHEMCHKIFGGQDKDTNKRVTISTWQSIFKMPPKYFQKFGMVIVDEAHTAKAKSLVNIMSKCTEAEYRLGATGTVGKDSKVNRMTLEGYFGTLYKVISTRKLMDDGHLSDLKIKILVLKYPDSTKSRNKNLKYQEEIDYIVTNKKRNEFITNLALKQDGNTLILFNFIEKHGIPLYELIKSKAHSSRSIFYVAGSTDADTREEVRKLTEKQSDAIICASLGVFSTGVNIKNLHNIIFASPSKSQIKVLQSIGRGLRKADNGMHCTLFDIVDDLSWKSYKNYALKHASERIKIYSTEKFEYKVFTLEFNDGN